MNTTCEPSLVCYIQDMKNFIIILVVTTITLFGLYWIKNENYQQNNQAKTTNNKLTHSKVNQDASEQIKTNIAKPQEKNTLEKNYNLVGNNQKLIPKDRIQMHEDKVEFYDEYGNKISEIDIVKKIPFKSWNDTNKSKNHKYLSIIQSQLGGNQLNGLKQKGSSFKVYNHKGDELWGVNDSDIYYGTPAINGQYVIGTTHQEVNEFITIYFRNGKQIKLKDIGPWRYAYASDGKTFAITQQTYRDNVPTRDISAFNDEGLLLWKYKDILKGKNSRWLDLSYNNGDYLIHNNNETIIQVSAQGDIQ